MSEAREASEVAEVRTLARLLDYDRYLAALLAPHSTHEGLLTLAAFHGEIARIPASVREPTIGAIRLQWWRDALEMPAAEATGSPVVDRLRSMLADDGLPIGEVTSIIDAYEELLRPGALAEHGAIDAFADATQGAAFRLAAGMLGGGGAEGSERLIAAAARSYGRVQLLRALPILLSKGHNPFATGPIEDWGPIVAPLLADARRYLDEVRRCAPLAPGPIRGAILPVALVEPYLRALERLGSTIAFEQAQISPLTRVWRIYVASRRRRF